ncbi:MAG: hypothetical protein ACPGVH_04255 [Chitinophagales bacterium]
MKKLVSPFIIVLALIVSLSACEKKSCEMCGEYTGTVSGPIKVLFAPVVETDTTLAGVGSKASIIETSYEDSVTLSVDVEIAGTPVSVSVNAFKDTETTFSVTNTIFKYGGAVPILVNGTGTADGKTCKATITIAGADGSTTAIDGKLSFTSN